MWFKIHEGFTSNRKFGLVANQLQIPRAEVIAIALDLIEYASRQADRGSILGYDVEASAYALDLSSELMRNALQALRNRGFCNDSVILNWDEYQGRSDATNADRQRRYRDKKKQEVSEEVTPVTDSNALRNIDKIREDKIRIEEKSNTKKKPVKITLQEWEEKNGVLTLEAIPSFVAKHGATNAAQHLSKFRTSCMAKGMQYVDFRLAIQAWDWPTTQSQQQFTTRKEPMKRNAEQWKP